MQMHQKETLETPMKIVQIEHVHQCHQDNFYPY